MKGFFNGFILAMLIFLGLLEIRERMCESEYDVESCKITAIPVMQEL